MNNNIVTYNDILKFCNDFGNKLSKMLNLLVDKPEKLIVAYDLIKRIGSNIHIVSSIKNDKFSMHSQNLLLRSVVSDLIQGLYLLSCNDELFVKGIKTVDRVHVQFFKESLELRTELYKKMRPEEIIGDLQPFMDKYYDVVSPYLNSSKGEPWNIVSLKEIRDDNMKCGIKEMCDALKSNADENLHQYYYLYHYYRLLSQSEHYTLLGRNYSSSENENLKIEVRVVIYAAIEQMDLLLEEDFKRAINESDVNPIA